MVGVQVGVPSCPLENVEGRTTIVGKTLSTSEQDRLLLFVSSDRQNITLERLEIKLLLGIQLLDALSVFFGSPARHTKLLSYTV